MTGTSELCGARTSRGYNQTTASGRAFYATDPRPEDVFIDDIAAHLSRICRFGGALKENVFVPIDTFNGCLTGEYKFVTDGVIVPLETYSVAQHSVLVSDNVPEPFRLRALLHDGAEAYIGDMIKPIKMVMSADWSAIYFALRRYLLDFKASYAVQDLEKLVPCFARLEARVQRVIFARFGLPEHDEEADAAIALADYRAVLTEHRDLQEPSPSVDWGTPTEEPFPGRIIPLLPSAARELFLERFNELYKGE